jgi:glycosyltransferase involved in cell wall biosynthesis
MTQGQTLYAEHVLPKQLLRFLRGFQWRIERIVAYLIKRLLVRRSYVPGGSSCFDLEIDRIIRHKSVHFVNLVSGGLLDPLKHPRDDHGISYSQRLAIALAAYSVLSENESLSNTLRKLGHRLGVSPIAALFWIEHPFLKWILPLPYCSAFYRMLWKAFAPPICISADATLLTRTNNYEFKLPRGTIPFSARPFGVNLMGPAFNVFGVGEEVRMAARALLSADIPFCVIDCPVDNGSPATDRSLDSYSIRTSEEGPYAFNLACMPADHHCPWICKEGLNQQKGRYTITDWPWETDSWPKPWHPIVALADEFWPFSKLVARALMPFSCEGETDSGVPLRVMPPVTAIDDPARFCTSEAKAETRNLFSLPSHSLLFVFAFDLNSYITRKNPKAAIEAFEEAFPIGAEGGPAVGLVVKTFPPRQPNPEWDSLKRVAAADSRIHIVEADLDRSAILSLYGCCDVFISLHRSEGLGRGLTEALQLGLDVVATDYGGNTDFCHGPLAHPVPYRLVPIREGEYPHPEGQVWAEPDGHEAAVILRRVAEERSLRPHTPPEITDRYRRQFSAATVGAAYRQRLEEIWSRRFSLDAELAQRHAAW